MRSKRYLCAALCCLFLLCSPLWAQNGDEEELMATGFRGMLITSVKLSDFPPPDFPPPDFGGEIPEDGAFLILTGKGFLGGLGLDGISPAAGVPPGGPRLIDILAVQVSGIEIRILTATENEIVCHVTDSCQP